MKSCRLHIIWRGFSLLDFSTVRFAHPCFRVCVEKCMHRFPCFQGSISIHGTRSSLFITFIYCYLQPKPAQRSTAKTKLRERNFFTRERNNGSIGYHVLRGIVIGKAIDKIIRQIFRFRVKRLFVSGTCFKRGAPRRCQTELRLALPFLLYAHIGLYGTVLCFFKNKYSRHPK